MDSHLLMTRFLLLWILLIHLGHAFWCFYSIWLQLLQMVPGLDRHREFVAADVGIRLIGGGLAGITAASLTYPLDLVRTRLAAQVSSSHHHFFLSLQPHNRLCNLYT
jgi:Mitochondrial carrier protein